MKIRGRIAIRVIFIKKGTISVKITY